MGPKTTYAKSDGVSIAYQVVGDGPFDVVLVPGFVSNVELYWENPGWAEIFDRLTSFARLILWDKRGTGLSDPVERVPTLDERAQDLLAVMDAAWSERAALFGISQGGSMGLVFATTTQSASGAWFCTELRLASAAPRAGSGASRRRRSRAGLPRLSSTGGREPSSICSLPAMLMMKLFGRYGAGSSGRVRAQRWPEQ